MERGQREPPGGAPGRPTSCGGPLLRALAAVTVLAALALWLLRAQIAGGFSHVLGDVNDTSIEIAILEHWFNVLRGRSSWSQTNFFFPHAGTLGYNDGYFLYGMLYALPRLLGADPYLAAHIVHVVVRLAAFPAFLAFATLALRIRFGFALAGATVFTLGNNLTIHTLHAQLLSVALVPLCGWLLYAAVDAASRGDHRRLLSLGSGFALVYGAWALTAFYTLWFFTFFCACLALWMALRHRRVVQSWLRRLDGRGLASLAVVAVLCLGSLLPFLRLYLPKASETGMHVFAHLRDQLPAPVDLVNIGLGNHLYGGLVRALAETSGFPWEFSERQMGLTPGVVALFLVAAAALWWRGRAAGTPPARLWLAQDLALVTIGTCLLTFSVSGHSAWQAVYEFVPGAKAIRAVARYYIVLAVPVVAVGMYWLALQRSRIARIGGAALCAFLVLEQLNMAAATAIDRGAATARLEAAKPYPGACRAFFVVDDRPAAAGNASDALYRHNVEAMLLAEVLGLPTINGFSSFLPPDWAFDHPYRADYLDRVRAYARTHDIRGLCALDLRTMTWSIEPLPRP